MKWEAERQKRELDIGGGEALRSWSLLRKTRGSFGMWEANNEFERILHDNALYLREMLCGILGT